ncbi:MAG: FAD-dependent oxidoreductase [Candidatus Paceibacterota bacterium]|jgi:alkyl hydroperoxide reductase subunit F
MYDLIIIGGGPAGVSAAIYAARKKLNTLIISDYFQGQSVVSAEIQNWIGTKSISGEALAKQIKDHLDVYQSDKMVIKEKEVVMSVTKISDGFEVSTNLSNKYTSKTILVATGGRRRKLKVTGADTYEQKGITYCASCDGPLFSGQDVVVIGGGNAGFGTAGQLLAYCKSVTLLENGDFRAEKITIDKLLANPIFKAVPNVDIIEIAGEQFVNKIVYKNRGTGETVELPTTGIFVEIGFEPNTDIVKDLVNRTPAGAIIIDHQRQTTSEVGVWAAGDSTNGLYHQNNISVGDAVKAVEDIYNFLQKK